MTTGSGSSRAAEQLVERQMLLRRVREQASALPDAKKVPGGARFITITRSVGALGDQVAENLAQHLHWHVFDREIVDFIAQDSHVRQDLVLKLDERAQSLVHDMVARLLLMAEGISFGNMEYHEALLKTLAYLAARGDAIIVGRGSAYALQGEPGLHIRLISSPEMRTRRLAERWDVPPDEARQRMHKIDAERRSFLHHHFGRTLEDPHFHDALFDTDRLTVEQIVHAVLGMMNVPADHVRAAEQGVETASGPEQ